MSFQLPRLPSAISLANSTLRLLVTVWSLLAVAAVFVMSLGTDEAWVLNGLRSALRPPEPHLSTELIATSGGAFALVNLVIEWAAGSQVWVHRLASLFFLGLSFALVLGAARSKAAPAPATWLVLAPLVAVPGAAEVGTAALGTSTGLALMVAAMSLWASPATSLAVRVVAGGLLYGMAAASRFDLVLFGPAVLLASCLRLTAAGRLEVRLNLPAWGFVSLGAAVFFLNQWAMTLTDNAMLVDDVGAATGLVSWSLDYPRLLNGWLTLTTFAPLSLLAVLAVSAFWSAPASTKPDSQAVTFEALLATTGVVLLIGWIFRAPIPHLRYVFPALFCFAALGAIGLQRLAIQSLENGSGRNLLMCYVLAVACVLGGVGTTVRSLAMSDSDIASWEWANESPHDYFRRLDARRHQVETAEFLRQGLPADARLYSYVPYALRYLTARPIVALGSLLPPDSRAHHANRYLVLTPMVGTYLYMNAATATWVQTDATLIRQAGRYSIYRLPPGNDADLQRLELRRTNYEGHPGSQRWFGR